MAISGPQKCFISDFFIVDMSRPANVTVPLMSRAGPFWSSPMMVRPRTRLAGTGFTHDAESFAGGDVDRDTVDCSQLATGVANTVLMLSACSSGTPF